MCSRLVLLFPFLLLAGCSSENGELSKKDDQELRHNFARALTPEEQAMMGKSKPAARPPK
jgi:hypothetical protein